MSILDLQNIVASIIPACIIAGFGGLIRYVNDIKNSRKEFYLKMFLLEILVSAIIGGMTIGIITDILKVESTNIQILFIFIFGIASTDIINIIIKTGPQFFLKLLKILLVQASQGLIKADELKEINYQSIEIKDNYNNEIETKDTSIHKVQTQDGENLV